MKVQALEGPNVMLPASSGSQFAVEKHSARQGAVSSPEVEDYREVIDRGQVKEALQVINGTMESYNTELRFSLDEDSREMVVKVIDTRDSSVIRQIPASHVLKLVAHIKEMLGMVIDKFI